MANPEWDNYDPNKRNCLTAKKEGKAMQEKEQDLTEYSKHIFTLKNRIQIEILTQKPYDEVAEENTATTHRIIKGFILTPLVVEKIVKIRKSEIVAREEIREPCIAHVIPWEQTDLDPVSKWACKRFQEPIEIADNKHPEDCGCMECYPINKPS